MSVTLSAMFSDHSVLVVWFPPDILLSRGFAGVDAGSELPVCACRPGAQCEREDERVGVQWAADLPCLFKLLQPLPSSSRAPTN